MPSLVLRVLAAFAATTVAAPSPDAALQSLFGVPEVLQKVTLPPSWTHVGKAPAHEKLNLHIALKHSNIEGLQATLDDIADHNSPNYGKWLSKEQVRAFTSPADGSIDAVRGWLKAAGIEDGAISHPSPDWIHVSVPVSKAEQLLQANYGVYNDDLVGGTVLRTLEYALPKKLHEHVETVQPTTSFLRNMAKQAGSLKRREPARRPRTSSVRTSTSSRPAPTQSAAPVDLKACAKEANPDCIRTLYNVDYKGKGLSSSAIAIFNRDTGNVTDLASFLKQYDPKTPATASYTEVYIGNATKDDTISMEPIMDSQMIVPLSYPNNVTMIHAGPDDSLNRFYEDMLSLTDYINNADHPPQVVSISYSGEEPTTPDPFYNRLCNEFSKATSRGVTFFISSGDDGVGRRSGTCKAFVPTFPTSCPYLTVVGGTQITDDAKNEVTAVFPDIGSGGSSGGGFSNLYPMPSWQQNDTLAYIKNFVSKDYDGLYNKSGRAYPDVAMLGRNVDMIYNGENWLGEGTSASAPIMAGLVTQINDYRLSLGKPSLGFLNPRLYTDANVRAALRDITSGSNPGCGTNGFTAQKGWDPVTGLGSFEFTALRKALST